MHQRPAQPQARLAPDQRGRLSGNGLTVSNGLTCSSSFAVFLYNGLTLGGSQAFTASPAAASLRVYGDVNLNGFNLTLANDGYLETQGAFAGTGNLTKSGTGKLLMAGGPNTFHGTLTQLAGEFDIAKALCLPTNFVSDAHVVFYSNNATHTNGDVTLHTGAFVESSGPTSNTIRNLNLTGARIEAIQLTLGLRGNLTTFAANTNSFIIAQLDLQNTNHLFTINAGAANPDLCDSTNGLVHMH